LIIGEDHIIDGVTSIVSTVDEHFELIYGQIKDPRKELLRNLLIYTDKILNKIFKDDDPNIKFHHIYFTQFDKNFSPLIFEFISIKLFYQDFFSSTTQSTSISEQINLIDEILKEGIQLKENVKSTDREYRQAIEKRKQLKEHKKFYEQLLTLKQPSPEILPKTILNAHKTIKTEISNNLLGAGAFAIHVEDLDISENRNRKKSSFVVLNSEYDRDDLDSLEFNGTYNLIDNIENVILFDCEEKSIHQKFRYSDLVELNTKESTCFKKLIVLTFDQHFRLSHLLSHIDRVETRYFIKPSENKHYTYTLLPPEINFLSSSPSKKLDVSFLQCDTIAYDDFHHQVNDIETIIELTSIKLRNIYSLCFSDKIREFIIADIFSSYITEPLFISKATKNSILQFDIKVAEELRSSLNIVLSNVQSSGIITRIKESIIDKKIHLVVPKSINLNKFFKKELLGAINMNTDINFIEWDGIKEINGPVIILDYRDCGKYPYRIYPNLFEIQNIFHENIKAIFLSVFFDYNFKNRIYDHSKALLNNINNGPFRSSLFDLKNMGQDIENAKPFHSWQDKNWDIENSFYGNSDRESLYVKYSTGTKKTFYHSQLFVVRSEKNEHLYTFKGDELLTQAKDISIQPIDELYEGLNLFDVTPEDEIEIKDLQRKYGLSSANMVEKLWKILLIESCGKDGKRIVYERLEKSLKNNSLNIVRYSHFETCWLNLNEDSLIPRSKKVFKLLCSFLSLPNTYLRIMLKKRAKERLLSRQSNSKMNSLIAHLIHDGLFDSKYNIDMIDENKYFQAHDLEDIGFTTNSTQKELIALIELLRPNLNLKEVQQIELRSNDTAQTK